MQKEAGFLKDTMTLSGRCLLLSKRNPDIDVDKRQEFGQKQGAGFNPWDHVGFRR